MMIYSSPVSTKINANHSSTQMKNDLLLKNQKCKKIAGVPNFKLIFAWQKQLEKYKIIGMEDLNNSEHDRPIDLNNFCTVM